ncbi:helix-turn-helix domain-containing protein [Sungkyunkwania multivorans]|uniref:Helix-turn-helix domain-containing protein n=1 Tax=Sungkyunkwania multivorans TaxID=1173618 RepID=A0ABW3D3M2_9FLAO
MNWNTFNIIIASAAAIVVLICVIKLFSAWKSKSAPYLYWFLITSSIVILQVLAIDIGITKENQWLLVLYLPFQFLSPVLFTALTCTYLDRMALFKKYRYLLLMPFVIFFILYTFLKVNVVLDFDLVSSQTAAQISAEWDENSAVMLSLILGIWNYKIIKDYEIGFGNLSYKVVTKRTRWLRIMYTILIILTVLWGAIIIAMKLDDDLRGHGPYYPLWLLFLGFYYVFLFVGEKHLDKVEMAKAGELQSLEEITTNFQLLGLNKVFASDELQILEGQQYDVTAILSYFATSLFDKQKEEDVLWDITKNCIAKLDLEDCVIYLLDKERQMLVQKAAYGNKDKGQRKILSPIEIPVGKGVVGAAAKTREWQLVQDVNTEERYILDDQQRMSELAVPIAFEDELLGVLDSEHSQKAFFNERHVFLFQLIAKLTATKLQQVSKKSTMTITNDNAYFKELCYLLENEHIYRSTELNLTKASEKLNISSNYLSQLVNKIADCNFSDFVNKYRVEDAKSKLANPEFSSYTMLAIGLEAGFNSKSTFYNAFKKHTGMSPSDYKENHPIESKIL